MRSNLEALKKEKKEKKRLKIKKEEETEAPVADYASDGEEEAVWFEDDKRLKIKKEGETEAPVADDASDGKEEEVWFEDDERPEHHKTIISMLNSRLREYNEWEAEKAWFDSREFRVPDHQQPVDWSFSNVRADTAAWPDRPA